MASVPPSPKSAKKGALSEIRRGIKRVKSKIKIPRVGGSTSDESTRTPDVLDEGAIPHSSSHSHSQIDVDGRASFDSTSWRSPLYDDEDEDFDDDSYKLVKLRDDRDKYAEKMELTEEKLDALKKIRDSNLRAKSQGTGKWDKAMEAKYHKKVTKYEARIGKCEDRMKEIDRDIASHREGVTSAAKQSRKHRFSVETNLKDHFTTFGATMGEIRKKMFTSKDKGGAASGGHGRTDDEADDDNNDLPDTSDATWHVPQKRNASSTVEAHPELFEGIPSSRQNGTGIVPSVSDGKDKGRKYTSRQDTADDCELNSDTDMGSVLSMPTEECGAKTNKRFFGKLFKAQRSQHGADAALLEEQQQLAMSELIASIQALRNECLDVRAGSVHSAELRSEQDDVIKQLQAQLEDRAKEVQSLNAKLDQYDQEVEKMVSKYSTSITEQLAMFKTDIEKEQQQVKHLQDEAEKYADRVGRNEVTMKEFTQQASELVRGAQGSSTSVLQVVQQMLPTLQHQVVFGVAVFIFLAIISKLMLHMSPSGAIVPQCNCSS
eukprot:m.506515 g.506515  ORF g.506515 m.506515 type:complete len:546 (-) comp21874_c0_seq32:666-2303(-)